MRREFAIRFGFTMLVFGVMIAAPDGMKYLYAHGFIPVSAKVIVNRGFLVVMGLLLVLVANQFPKMLRPNPHAPSSKQAVAQSTMRFASLVLVIAGLAFSLTWLVAPTELARPFTVYGMLAAVVIVFAGIVLGMARALLAGARH